MDKEVMFEAGKIVQTQGASSISTAEVTAALTRHFMGDWGEVCKDDKDANDEAVRDGRRIMSVYCDSNGVQFWIITEADRSVTTILLSVEY